MKYCYQYEKLKFCVSAARLRIGQLIFFLYLFLFEGYTLKCNQCVSLKSWDDCKKGNKEVNCEDFCASVHLGAENLNSGLTINEYVKGCSSFSFDCDLGVCQNVSQWLGPSWNVSKCELECCKSTEDFCNSYPDSHLEDLVPTTTFLPGKN